MSHTALVTGPTGKTGRRLIPLLAGSGVSVRAAYQQTDAAWIRQLLLVNGATEAFAEGVVELTTMSIDDDFMAAVTGDVQAVTGRPPVSFADYARPAAAAWR